MGYICWYAAVQNCQGPTLGTTLMIQGNCSIFHPHLKKQGGKRKRRRYLDFIYILLAKI